MITLPYTVIKNKKQYQAYCARHQELVFGGAKSKNEQDELELLELLIDTWDEAHNTFQTTADPVALIKLLMQEHQMQAKDLAAALGISKSLMSEILNYKKSLSKEVIRLLSVHFKIQQESLNVPYNLKNNEWQQQAERIP